MKTAFTYMFKDNKFWQKALVLFALMLPAFLLTEHANIIMNSNSATIPGSKDWINDIQVLDNMLSLLYKACTFMCISFLLIIPAYGYRTTCIRYLQEQKENFILPFFNFKRDFITGIKYMIMYAIVIIPLSTVMYILLFRNNGIIPNYYMAIMYILFFFYIIFYYAFTWLFAKKESIFTLFKIKTVLKLVWDNKLRYLKIYGLAILIFLLLKVLIIALGYFVSLSPVQYYTNYVTILVETVIGCFYISFVKFYLTAKCIEPKEETIA